VKVKSADNLLKKTETNRKSNVNFFTPMMADQNYFTDQTELEVMSYVETYQEATRVEIL
jgi:hypothetical protein